MSNVNLALVGCGRISQRHIEAVQANEGIKIITVCDIDEKKAAEKSGIVGCNYVTSIKDIRGADVVTVATPSGAHPRDVMAVADHCDCHYIICEKPVSLTVREAVEMFKYVKNRGKTLLPVYQNRYNPLVEFIKEMIDAGHLGRIFQFDCNVFWNRNDAYFDIDWHGTMDLDGGVLYTQASHYVDMLLFFFGKVRDCKGMGGNMRGFEVHDTASAVFKFENGTIGSLNSTVSVYRQNYMTEMTLLGEKGTIRLTGTNLNTIDFWDVNGFEKPDLDFTINHQYGKGHDKMYEYVVKKEWGRFPAYDEVLEGIALMEKLSF